MSSKYIRMFRGSGLLLLAALILLSSSVLVAQTDKPTLAVLNFDGLGISEPEVATLTNRFRANLAQVGPYTIIERGLMAQILQEQGFQETGCTTAECAVEVGQLLGAQLILAGSIGLVGSTWTVEMRIINVESGAIEKTAFYDTQGAIDLMLTEGMAAAARRIVNVEMATSAVNTPVTVEMVRKLTAPMAQAQDFGTSVAINADYIIVGAKDSLDEVPGTAYVFRRIGTNSWDTGIKLTAPDAQGDNRFGYSVAISGDYAIVGAAFDDAEGDQAGAAYVFRRTGANSWDNGTKLTAPDAKEDDRFGTSVAINGNYTIVGASQEDTKGDAAGAAYVFRRTGISSWDTGTKITAPDAREGDRFGISVAIDRDYAIVGASQFGGIHAAGAAYVFRRTGINSWDTDTKLTAPDATDDDNFGTSVALLGDYAIVGADAVWKRDGGSYAGVAYVFLRTGINSWDIGTKLIALDAQEGDCFGSSVAIEQDYAIVGAERNDTGGNAAGAAYVFRHTGANSWDTGIKLTAPDTKEGDFFGQTVAISGDYAIVGAGRTWTGAGGSNAGEAYVFRIK